MNQLDNDDEGAKTSKLSMILQNQKKKKNVSILARGVLIANKWLFYNDNGYLGEMTFDDNGKIKGYNTHNERTWKLSQHAYAHTLLEIYGDGNKKTCTFISSILDATGKWK